MDELIQQAAERMWSIHPNDLDKLGFIHTSKGGNYDHPRRAYYESEIKALIEQAVQEAEEKAWYEGCYKCGGDD